MSGLPNRLVLFSFNTLSSDDTDNNANGHFLFDYYCHYYRGIMEEPLEHDLFGLQNPAEIVSFDSL